MDDEAIREEKIGRVLNIRQQYLVERRRGTRKVISPPVPISRVAGEAIHARICAGGKTGADQLEEIGKRGLSPMVISAIRSVIPERHSVKWFGLGKNHATIGGPSTMAIAAYKQVLSHRVDHHRRVYLPARTVGIHVSMNDDVGAQLVRPRLGIGEQKPGGFTVVNSARPKRELLGRRHGDGLVGVQHIGALGQKCDALSPGRSSRIQRSTGWTDLLVYRGHG
jgi:hypothetical protein